MMEHRFEERSIRHLKRDLWQVQEREQTQEVRLGEDLPDVGNILCVRGQCILRSKEWMREEVGVSGGVMAWVMYAPADGSAPRTVEVWIPVQLKWPMPQTDREGTIRTAMSLRSIDARTVSARKLMVRAAVSAFAEALEPCQTEVCVPSEMEDGIQLLKKTYPAVLPVEAGEKSFMIDELVPFPAGSGEVAEIRAFKLDPRASQTQVVGGKAVFRGEAKLQLMCEDGEGTLFPMELSVPFAQFSDLDRDYEQEATLGLTMAVTDLSAELQEGGVQLKCGLLGQYVVHDRILLEVAEDAYCPGRELEIRSRELELPMMLDSGVETVCTQTVLGTDVARVVDVWTEGAQPKLHRAGDLVEMELSGTTWALYLDTEGKLQGASGLWSQVVELPVAGTAAVTAELMEQSRPTVSVVDGKIQARQELVLGTSAQSQRGVAMLCSAVPGQALERGGDRPSVILRRSGGQSLWELAKGCGSTVDAIRKANGITEEPLDGRMLLIPVCS